MRVNAKDFTSLKGHVADNCEIISSHGKLHYLKNTFYGWVIYDDKNTQISGNLTNYFDVECFVVRGLGA